MTQPEYEFTYDGTLSEFGFEYESQVSRNNRDVSDKPVYIIDQDGVISDI